MTPYDVLVQRELDALRAENERLRGLVEKPTYDGYATLHAEVERASQEFAEQRDMWADELHALRAENERLKAELVEADRKLREYRPNVDGALAENERLRAENERLKGERQVAKDLWDDAVRDRDAARAENERLRAALERLVNACEREDWDANADNGSDPDLDAARAALASDNHH